jgi:thioredoxin-related protein
MPASERGSTRRLPLALAAAAGVLLLARVAFGVWEEHHPVDRPEAVMWRPITTGENEAALREGLVLYFFTSPSEKACRAMSNEMFAEERVASTIERLYVPVKVVDMKKETHQNLPEVEALERHFAVRTFPTLVAADPKSGKFEHLEGYPGAMETTRWLATVPRVLMKSLPMRMIGGAFGAPDSTRVDSVIHLGR